MRLPLYFVFLFAVLLLPACGSGDTRPSQEPPSATTAEADGDAETPSDTAGTTDEIVVMMLGDSITAGYGIGEDNAFPALLQARVDSLGWDVRIINAGLSGETSAGGLRRIDWLLRERIDVLLIELGGNDGLRGTAPEVTRQNLQGIIDQARERYPDVTLILAGMQVPPNLGLDYTTQFRDLFPDLARENETALIPFILEGVGGVPRLNLPDGIHPTAEGHTILAETVWDTLEPILIGMQS
ncbi:MAG: arylesterase [Bacteroidota bacterium]